MSFSFFFYLFFPFPTALLSSHLLSLNFFILFLSDDATTTVFIVGASLGEAILPIIVGVSIEFYGPYSLIVIVFTCVLSISILFLLIDRVSLKLISQAHQANILSFFSHSTKDSNRSNFVNYTYSHVTEDKNLAATATV